MQARAGFDKSSRLLNACQFRKVLSRGRKYRGRMFLLVGLPTGHAFPRLGITVSRKVSRHAVVRNSIKRQVREYFRQNRCTMPKHDFVVIAHPPAARAQRPALCRELAAAWKWSAASDKANEHHTPL